MTVPVDEQTLTSVSTGLSCQIRIEVALKAGLDVNSSPLREKEMGRSTVGPAWLAGVSSPSIIGLVFSASFTFRTNGIWKKV
jgi:hypothetical protein